MNDQIRGLTMDELDDVSGGVKKVIMQEAIKYLVGVVMGELLKPIDFSKLRDCGD